MSASNTASMLLPIVSLAACVSGSTICFFLTRRVSQRPWLWSLVAVVVYLGGIYAVKRVAFDDVPSERAAAHAYNDGKISLNEYEQLRDDDLHARYVSFGPAFALVVLMGAAKRWSASPPSVSPDTGGERQIAGETCALCGKAILTAHEGVVRKRSGRAVHRACRSRVKRAGESLPS